MVENVISTAVRLAVASGLLSWPLALAAVLLAALLLVLVRAGLKVIPDGTFFPTTAVPEPEVAPPMVVSPDGTIPLDQVPAGPAP